MQQTRGEIEAIISIPFLVYLKVRQSVRSFQVRLPREWPLYDAGKVHGIEMTQSRLTQNHETRLVFASAVLE